MRKVCRFHKHTAGGATRDYTGERDPRIFCGGQALKKIQLELKNYKLLIIERIMVPPLSIVC
jgi:hypothetical protein